MSKPSRRAEPKLNFEQALAELEKIVARMESGELSLEQSLATHKRGLELARFCPEAGGGPAASQGARGRSPQAARARRAGER